MKNLKSKLIISFLIIGSIYYLNSNEDTYRKISSLGMDHRKVVPKSEIIEKIIKDLGPIVEQDKYPVLQRHIQSIFNNLSNSMISLSFKLQKEEQYPESFQVSKIENELLIIDTPLVNAFAASTFIKQDDVINQNIIVLTTGLIDQFYHLDESMEFNQKEFSKWESRLIGTLSHEIAHPIDTMDPFGVQVGGGDSQAVEIKTDFTGAEIARRSGYDHHNVLYALDDIIKSEKTDKLLQSIVQAKFSTHPQRDFRLGTLALGGTLTSLNKGEVRDVKYKALSKDLVWEFSELKKKNLLSPVVSFNDGITRLNSLVDDVNSTKNLVEKVYINFLNFLHDYSATNNEISEIVSLNIRLKDVLTNNCDVAIIEKANSLKIYNSAQYKKELKKTFETFLNTESYSEFFKSIAVYSQFYPEKELFFESKEKQLEVVREEFLKQGQKINDLSFNVIAERLNSISDKLALDTSIISARGVSFRYYDLVIVSLNTLIKDKGRFYNSLNQSREGFSKLFERSSYDRIKGYSQLSNKSRIKSLNISKIEREFSRYIYSNIDEFSFREVISNQYKKIDWHNVFKILGKDINTEMAYLKSQLQLIDEKKVSIIINELIIKDADHLRNALFHYTENTMFTSRLVHKGWINQKNAKYLKSLYNPEDRGYHIIARGLYYHNTDLFRADFRNEFSIKIKAFEGLQQVSNDELVSLIHHVLFKVSGSHTYAPAPILDIVAKQIEASKLNEDLKNTLFLEIFVEEKNKNKWSDFTVNSKVSHAVETSQHREFDMMDMGGRAPRHTHRMGNSSRKILKSEGPESWMKEKRNQTNRRILNVLLTRFEKPKTNDEYKSLLKIYNKVGNDLDNPNLFFDKVLKELDKGLGSTDRISEEVTYQFIETLTKLGKGDRLHSLLIPVMDKHDISLESKIKIYQKITPPGTIYSDKYFERVIFPYLTDEVINKDSKEVFNQALNFLKPKYAQTPILSEDLKVNLFKMLFNHKSPSGNYYAGYESFMENHQTYGRKMDFESGDFSALEVKLEKQKLFLSLLRQFLPNKSFSKDSLIENYMWEFDVANLDMLKKFEHLKTFYVNKSGAALVSKGSVMSQYFSHLSDNQKWKVLEYIINTNTSMPSELLDVADKDIENMLGEFDSNFDSEVQKISTKEEKKIIFKGQLENKISNLKQAEKIFIINLLLMGGDNPLIEKEGSIEKVISRYLNISENDDSAKYLRAQLKSISLPEVSPTLSYLLASNSGGKVELIEIFSLYKSVGVKTGQFAAIWKFFDEETNKKLEKLKDDAPKLSKFELTKRLHLVLPKNIVDEIKIVNVLGAASIKTVVLIEYKGKEIVMALKDPDASSQTKSNILRAKRFLKELEHEKIDFPRYFVSNFLDSMEESILEEIDFKKEAEKIILQRDAYQKMNKIFEKELLFGASQWKLIAPDLVTELGEHEDLIFQTKASGVSFHKIKDQSVRKNVGRMIVKSSLHEFFEYGLFDSDRHTGNYLIDESNHVIHVIDPGQSEYYSKSILEVDERYNLFQFFKAIEGKNSRRVIDGLTKMSKKSISTLSVDEIAKIIRETDKTTERLINIINYFAKEGGQLEKKYMFSLKGILTLAQDGYIDEMEFQKLFKIKVKNYLLKHPKSYLEPVFGNKCLRSISRFLK